MINFEVSQKSKIFLCSSPISLCLLIIYSRLTIKLSGPATAGSAAASVGRRILEQEWYEHLGWPHILRIFIAKLLKVFPLFHLGSCYYCHRREHSQYRPNWRGSLKKRTPAPEEQGAIQRMTYVLVGSLLHKDGGVLDVSFRFAYQSEQIEAMYHKEERAEQEKPGSNLMNSEGRIKPVAHVQ